MKKLLLLVLLAVLTVYAAWPLRTLADDSSSINITTSGGWSDPVNYGHFIHEIGLGPAIAFLLVLAVVVFSGYALWCTIGPKGFVRQNHTETKEAQIKLLEKLGDAAEKKIVFQKS